MTSQYHRLNKCRAAAVCQLDFPLGRVYDDHRSQGAGVVDKTLIKSIFPPALPRIMSEIKLPIKGGPTMSRKDSKDVTQAKPDVSRRKFLSGAAAATTGAVIAGFPMIAKSQGVTTMRWQSTWPSKDIFHEFALDFAKKVNDMTGGDLKIEVLPAGSVVPAFGLLDAVSK